MFVIKENAVTDQYCTNFKSSAGGIFGWVPVDLVDEATQFRTSDAAYKMCQELRRVFPFQGYSFTVEPAA